MFDASLAGRVEVFKEVAALAEPIEFGYEIVLSLPDTTSERGSIQTDMLGVLAARIADADTANPLLACDEPRAMLFLDIWAEAGDKVALQASLTRQFEKDPCAAGRLVQRTVPRYSRLDGTDHKYMPLGREGYDRISRFIDAGELTVFLRKALPNLDRDRQYERGSIESAVRQFLDLYDAISSAGAEEDQV